MSRRKTHRISRPIRRAAKAFNRFADRLSSMIAAEIKQALKVAVEEEEKARSAQVEVPPVEEVKPDRKVHRRRSRRAAVVQIGQHATAPRVPRKRGRPPAQVAAAPAVDAVAAPVSTPPEIVVKVLPPKRRRLRRLRSNPVQVKGAPAPQVIRRPGSPSKDGPVDMTPEIAADPSVMAEEAAQVVEPVDAVEPEHVMPSPTKPLDRLTRMRTSFRPGKIVLVNDDAAVPPPEGERASGE